MKLSTRISRTYAVGSLAARVYLGYKWISVREKHFRLRPRKANRKRLRHHTWSANHFYDVAVRRQGLLIKLGQIIGSRPDLIPDEYIDVLSRLQDAVPPRPFNTIRRVIERELKRPLADLFDDFEETPIASASLAQVHRARLKPTASEPEGRVVAVKVQYPGIGAIVDNDLQNVRLLLHILARFEGNLDFTPIIEELSHNAPQELDFINEGRNAEIIAGNFGPDPAHPGAGRDDVVVPEIIWEYSTKRVLTMEFMEGIKITDVEALRREGIDPQAVAQLVTDVYCEQLYIHGMFHADPHPGNLLVQPGPTLVMLDFGLCRQYDDTFRLRYAKMTNAMLRWDLPALVEAYKELGIKVKNPDDPAVYVEMGRAFMKTSRPGKAYADPDLVAESNQRFEKAMRSNPVTDIPRELLLIMRVTGLLSGLGKHLESRVDVTQTLLPYTEAALAETK